MSIFLDKEKLWVDPPKGWLYGFPKVWIKKEQPDLKFWLIKEGYPEKEYEACSGNHIRFWEAK